MQSKQPIRELILHVLKMYLFTGMVEHSGLSSALLFTIIIYYILNKISHLDDVYRIPRNWSFRRSITKYFGKYLWLVLPLKFFFWKACSKKTRAFCKLRKSVSINLPCVRRRRKGREKSQKPFMCMCLRIFRRSVVINGRKCISNS